MQGSFRDESGINSPAPAFLGLLDDSPAKRKRPRLKESRDARRTALPRSLLTPNLPLGVLIGNGSNGPCDRFPPKSLVRKQGARRGRWALSARLFPLVEPGHLTRRQSRLEAAVRARIDCAVPALLPVKATSSVWSLLKKVSSERPSALA